MDAAVMTQFGINKIHEALSLAVMQNTQDFNQLILHWSYGGTGRITLSVYVYLTESNRASFRISHTLTEQDMAQANDPMAFLLIPLTKKIDEAFANENSSRTAPEI